MIKNGYNHDFQYDWSKPIKKEEKFSMSNKSNKVIQQNSNGNLINNNINLNTISNYNNINTIQNTNSLGKLNINMNNDSQNMNLYMNVSTTKNGNQNFLSKSNTKIPKGITIETNLKYSGFNYNYNFPINNVTSQRASMNNLSTSKLNFMEMGPKTNKNEGFPTL